MLFILFKIIFCLEFPEIIVKGIVCAAVKLSATVIVILSPAFRGCLEVDGVGVFVEFVWSVLFPPVTIIKSIGVELIVMSATGEVEGTGLCVGDFFGVGSAEGEALKSIGRGVGEIGVSNACNFAVWPLVITTL